MSTMRVATIVPISQLDLIEEQDYHLCLAHLAPKSKSYREFYTRQSQKPGSYVILDNGAAEGASQPIEFLVEAALQIGAHELVLPDVLFDAAATLRSSYTALSYISSQNMDTLNTMVVPQGRTLQEWYRCAEVMMGWPVTCIGISKFLSTKEGYVARLRARGFLEKEWLQEKPHRPRKQVHLLGCNSHVGETLMVASKYSVRGTDSAIAYIFTKAGVSLGLHTSRPKEEIDFFEAEGAVDDTLLRANIRLWTEAFDQWSA